MRFTGVCYRPTIIRAWFIAGHGLSWRKPPSSQALRSDQKHADLPRCSVKTLGDSLEQK